jgi:replicative superfamily II helicase
MEERKLLEEAARSKILNVLVATTTLSAGVNIHSVSLVFVMSIYRWTPTGNVTIPATQFTQMVGRAGRLQGQSGEAIVFARTSSPLEVREIVDFCAHAIPPLASKLSAEADRFFLQSLAVGLVPDAATFLTYGFRASSIGQTAAAVTSKLTGARLLEHGRPTVLGRAIAGSALGIEEGLRLHPIVAQMQADLCLDDEVHLLYLCVPDVIVQTMRPEPYDSVMWRYILRKHRHVIRLITGFDDKRLDRMEDLPTLYGSLGRVDVIVDSMFDKIYVAVILKQLVNETPAPEITEKFGVDRGVLQSWQMQASSFAGQLSKFCELIGAGLLGAALNRFRQRLNFGARTDLLPLMSLPSCSRDIARRLVRAGVASPVELAELDEATVSALLAEGRAGDDELDRSYEAARNVLRDAKDYTESMLRLEAMEEFALQNI